MRIKSIQTKVFLMLLALTLAVVLVMSFMMRHGVERQFNIYKKKLDDDLNLRVVGSLQELYSNELSWQSLQDNPRLWGNLLTQSAMEVSIENKNKRIHFPDPEEKKKLRRFIPQFSLLDAHRQMIVGMKIRSDDRYIELPIYHDKKVVGYLLNLKHEKDKFKSDMIFNEKIKQFLWIMTSVMLVLVLIASVPIARYFTRPIRAINEATKEAAAGDYSVRTNINRIDELGQLGQNFNLLTSTLQSNTEIHKKMMADISHELRTPVAVLLAETEAIQDGIHQADEKSLQLLHQQITALKHLINDLHQLSLTDLGSMQYQMAAVDIQPILLTVIASQKLAAAAKNINIHFKEQPQERQLVMGDVSRLQQMFSNILSNSVNYTDAGGVIEIDSYFDATNNEFVIKVADSKPGLMAEEMKQIFDRMYRKESSRNKKTGGSGLGLAIVKNIVEAHNGNVYATASDLGGICMTVRLPAYV